MWNSTDIKTALESLFRDRYSCDDFEAIRTRPHEAFLEYGMPQIFDIIEGWLITEPKYTDFTNADGLADYLRSILNQATAELSGRDALIFAAGMFQAAAPSRPRRANWGPKTHAAYCQAMADLIMREIRLTDSDMHPWSWRNLFK